MWRKVIFKRHALALSSHFRLFFTHETKLRLHKLKKKKKSESKSIGFIFQCLCLLRYLFICSHNPKGIKSFKNFHPSPLSSSDHAMNFVCKIRWWTAPEQDFKSISMSIQMYLHIQTFRHVYISCHFSHCWGSCITFNCCGIRKAWVSSRSCSVFISVIMDY